MKKLRISEFRLFRAGQQALPLWEDESGNFYFYPHVGVIEIIETSRTANKLTINKEPDHRFDCCNRLCLTAEGFGFMDRVCVFVEEKSTESKMVEGLKAKLKLGGLSDEQIDMVLDAINTTCNVCWRAQVGCQCWNDV